MSTELQRRAEALMAVGRLLYAMGMVPATSGNFAARPADDNLAITVSGRHKGRLTQEDIMLADAVHRLKQQPKKSGNALTPPPGCVNRLESKAFGFRP